MPEKKKTCAKMKTTRRKICFLQEWGCWS